MAVSGEDSSFLVYTAEWTKAINRGGHFEVSNAAYLFFCAMEGQVRTLLRAYTISGTVSEAEVLASVCGSDDVLFHWDLLTGVLNIEQRVHCCKSLPNCGSHSGTCIYQNGFGRAQEHK